MSQKPNSLLEFQAYICWVITLYLLVKLNQNLTVKTKLGSFCSGFEIVPIFPKIQHCAYPRIYKCYTKPHFMVVQLHFLGGQTEKSSANDFWHGKHVKLSVGKQQFFWCLFFCCSIFLCTFFRANHLLLSLWEGKKNLFIFHLEMGKNSSGFL